MGLPSFKEIGIYLDDYIYGILDLLTVVLYAIIGVLYEHGDKCFFDVLKYEVVGFYLLCGTVVLTLIIGILQLRRTKRLSQIEQENDAKSSRIQRLENDIDELYAEYNKIFNSQLALMAKSLNFTTNERISVYRHEKDRFVIIGRYSLHHHYNTIRLKEYPDDQGFISKAWLSPTGELYINNIPKENQLKTPKNPYYASINGQCVIDFERLKQMRMKSRNYFLKTLNDLEDTNRLAIIVFESIDENKLAKDRIISLLETESQRITSFITKMRVEYRTQETATRAGV